MVNNRGPRMDPWGTPLTSLHQFDSSSSTLIFCDLFDKYEERSCNADSWKPNALHLAKISSWFAQTSLRIPEK